MPVLAMVAPPAPPDWTLAAGSVVDCTESDRRVNGWAANSARPAAEAATAKPAILRQRRRCVGRAMGTTFACRGTAGVSAGAASACTASITRLENLLSGVTSGAPAELRNASGIRHLRFQITRRSSALNNDLING